MKLDKKKNLKWMSKAVKSLYQHKYQNSKVKQSSMIILNLNFLKMAFLIKKDNHQIRLRMHMGSKMKLVYKRAQNEEIKTINFHPKCMILTE